MKGLNPKKLRTELGKRGITQRELAKRMGISEITVSRYFSGDRFPNGHLLDLLAAELRTTPEYLADLDILETPSEAFNKARTAIMTESHKWSKKQRMELVNYLLEGME